MSQDKLEVQNTADGFDTLYSDQYRQTFHSKFGALLEAEHVFLNGTGINRRLAEHKPARVLEVGFGTGLNFFITARHSRTANALLHYVALERNLLPVAILTQLNHGQMLKDAGDIRQAFLAWRDRLSDPLPTKTLCWNFSENIRLEIIPGDATVIQTPNLGYHAIYHDAFSPEANPELWAREFFARLYPLLTPGGALATYSAKGTVRRNLQAAGFQVQKKPGPPGKREMLVARR